MTPRELHLRINEAKARQEKNLKDIASFCRNLIPVLKDAKLNNSADELSRLLFTYDAEENEFHNWITGNSEEIITAMIEGLQNRNNK